MPRRLSVVLFATLLCLLPGAPARAQDPAPASVSVSSPALPETYLALSTRPGVTLPVLLLAPEDPVGAVILFAGGGGSLGITGQAGQAQLKRGGNFLVRSRQLFAARGLAVAVVDAPSDRADGMSGRFRFSEEHLEDVRKLAAYVHERYGHRPWLVGTSMGTLSAGYCAAHLGEEIGGLVLTSSVTKAGKRWDIPANRQRAALDAGLGLVRVPALVVRHAGDSCEFSAPQDGPRLLAALTSAPRRELLTFEGGLPAQSDACEALSAHGYFGIEAQVVAGVAAFILNGTGTPATPAF